MDYRVLFTDRALTDLQAIIRTIAEDNPQVAQRFGEALINHIMLLRFFPLMGPDYAKRPGTKLLLHTPYRIF